MKKIINIVIGTILCFIVCLGIFRGCSTTRDFDIKETVCFVDNDNSVAEILYKSDYYKKNYLVITKQNDTMQIHLLFELNGKSAIHYFGGFWNVLDVNYDSDSFFNYFLEIFGIRYYKNSKNVFNIKSKFIGYWAIGLGRDVEYRYDDNLFEEFETKSRSGKIIFYDDNSVLLSEKKFKKNPLLGDDFAGYIETVIIQIIEKKNN
jgi:hypothetical protein